jgi:hypothetical protein
VKDYQTLTRSRDILESSTSGSDEEQSDNQHFAGNSKSDMLATRELKRLSASFISSGTAKRAFASASPTAAFAGQKNSNVFFVPLPCYFTMS